MFTIIISLVVLYWIVQAVIIKEPVIAAIITFGIVFLFVDIDVEKEKVGLKTKVEIQVAIDDARDAVIDGVDRIDDISSDAVRGYKEAKPATKNTFNADKKMVKIDTASLNFPEPTYLDMSKRSSTKATFYTTKDGVVACLNNLTDDCFKNIVIRTHSDGTRYICKGTEVCYKAD